MRAAEPIVYLDPRMIAAEPTAMNNRPDQKSFGWRMTAMRSSYVSIASATVARREAPRRIASRSPPGEAARQASPSKRGGPVGPPLSL